MENNKKLIEEMNVENKIELNDQELENANGAGVWDEIKKMAETAKDVAGAIVDELDITGKVKAIADVYEIIKNDTRR